MNIPVEIRLLIPFGDLQRTFEVDCRDALKIFVERREEAYPSMESRLGGQASSKTHSLQY